MINKSIMVAVADNLGGNAVFIDNATIVIANIKNETTTVIGQAKVPGEVRLINNDAATPFDLAAADEDDTELLGSRALAAGGRALAKKADTGVALVKGSSGWVGVRA